MQVNWKDVKEQIRTMKEDVLEEVCPGDVLRMALNLCSCGTGEDFTLLEETLRFCALPNDERFRREDEWKDGLYRSPGHELAGKLLDCYDLIEHGSSIAWAWATPDGHLLLELMDSYK